MYTLDDSVELVWHAHHPSTQKLTYRFTQTARGFLSAPFLKFAW